jgi:hypothetical protein
MGRKHSPSRNAIRQPALTAFEKRCIVAQIITSIVLSTGSFVVGAMLLFQDKPGCAYVAFGIGTILLWGIADPFGVKRRLCRLLDHFTGKRPE